MSQQELRADTFHIITSTGPAIGPQLLLTPSLQTLSSIQDTISVQLYKYFINRLLISKTYPIFATINESFNKELYHDCIRLETQRTD